MKRKYLNVEILNGGLYIYTSDKKILKSKTVTLEAMDTECLIEDPPLSKNQVWSVPLSDFNS